MPPGRSTAKEDIAMAIGILAAVLGLLFGTAAIVIPRIAARRYIQNHEARR